MKNKAFFLLPLLLLSIGCSNNTDSSSEGRHYYSEVENKMIGYMDVFNDQSQFYYIYYYEPGCIYCARIINEVVGFALKTDKPFYFIDVEGDVPTYSKTKEDTIGVNDPLYAFCNSTPQLSIVENGKIKDTFIDNEEIKNYLASNS